MRNYYKSIKDMEEDVEEIKKKLECTKNKIKGLLEKKNNNNNNNPLLRGCLNFLEKNIYN